ncbi:MAG: primosomal protein N' [Paracoccaceae bacterium]
MKKNVSNLSVTSFKKGETVSVVTVQKGKEFLDYLVPKDGIVIGSIVKVPLKNKITIGVVWCKGLPEQNSFVKKKIYDVINITPLSSEVREFIFKVSKYNIFSLNTAVRLTINPNLNLELTEKTFFYELGKFKKIKLTPSRDRVIKMISTNYNKKLTSSEIITETGVSKSVLVGLEKLQLIKKTEFNQESIPLPQVTFSKTLTYKQKKIAKNLREKVRAANYSTILLKGVTGSGKTEIYMEAISEAISLNKQVLVLFPEISLSSNFCAILKQRFKKGFAEWHSSIGKKQKRSILKNILNGSLKLVFGARSAVFLPFKNLGLVIVDEEHDTSYKQEEGTHYNGRDMAVLKGYYSRATVILVSATPSIETWVNVKKSKYDHISIKERFGNAILPEINIVDLRNKKLPSNRWISNNIIDKINDRINKNQQSLLFINRRGYSPTLLCRKCYMALKCQTCDSNLNEHKILKSLLCHLCGTKYPYPEKCEFCGNEKEFIPIGPGVERIEEEIVSLFPDAKVKTISSDHFGNIVELQKIFDKIISGKLDIIIGTQIISKGHNFPLLSFVGVIDIDVALQGGDIRAVERTFQLLRQVVGRSGRFNIPGEAIIQTYFPDHEVMHAIRNENDEDFLDLQSNLRKEANVPPFTRMIAVIISGANYKLAFDFARQLTKDIFSLNIKNIEIYGPADAKISKIRNKYRIRILMKVPKNFSKQELLIQIFEKRKCPSFLNLKIDVDPLSFT